MYMRPLSPNECFRAPRVANDEVRLIEGVFSTKWDMADDKHPVIPFLAPKTGVELRSGISLVCFAIIW
jgi:hypothetical protein